MRERNRHQVGKLRGGGKIAEDDVVVLARVELSASIAVKFAVFQFRKKDNKARCAGLSPCPSFLFLPPLSATLDINIHTFNHCREPTHHNLFYFIWSVSRPNCVFFFHFSLSIFFRCRLPLEKVLQVA